MPAPTSIKVDYRIHALSSGNASLSVIQRRLKEEGIIITRETIRKSLNHEGKRREARISGNDFKVQRKPKVLTPKVLNAIAKQFQAENPPTFLQASGSMRLAPSTINAAVLKRLNLRKVKKRKVQYLSENDCKNRKRNSRKLYEEVLSGNKSDLVVSLDESWIECPKREQPRNHHYVGRKKRETRKYVQPVKENFPEKFMIVGSMCSKRTFPLIKVPPKVTVDSKYFVSKVLDPLIHKHLIPYYNDDIKKVTIHFDKAPSHTSNYTANYLYQMKEKYGISFVMKDDIPVKGADISPMDFFGFGFLKQQLQKSRARTAAGKWKVARKIWDEMCPKKCGNVFEAWKRRLRVVYKIDGQQCEATKEIHKRKIKN